MPPDQSPLLASEWWRFIHPEGQPYFVYNRGKFEVVTEANVENPGIGRRILDWLELVEAQLKEHDIAVPQACELFLELDEVQQHSCNYYFVDHTSRALFWLEDLGTDLLDISAATSRSHLEQGLERLYWVHVEFFPMHHKGVFLPEVVDNLYDVISHGQADRLTSRTSTFPYTPDLCNYFLKLLARKRGLPVDGYTLCYVARLYGAISNQRFMTFYGQEGAQLDRLQEMYPEEAREHQWMSTVANTTLWGIPRYYDSLLEDLFVNEQVYADQWTRFMSLCLADWSNSLSFVSSASILLANVRGGTLATAIPSIFSCTLSIASASCLHLRHQPLAEASAATAARYLRSAKSYTVGFLPSAVVFSLPKGSYLWGVGFLVAQFLFVASRNINRFVALAAATILAAILLFIVWVISPEEGSWLSLLRSFTSSFSPHLYPSTTAEHDSMA
ncbi:hypothetical protein HYDPIDRAFT_96268 [Hydnomerulius pinastri MD-312]|uniref:Uncharacterized protein n=1 Tax=Hydnomerulius pinastri MD-312 TaxID=994086 RepID=A0A0C9VUE2_9AGAM|nr:hypothetical protein HYDPIDRAFT_96268 [Hydnomerulius pinastri MD-312]